MKFRLFIILLSWSQISKAQLITIDTCFANNSSKQFFEQNRLVDKVFFSIYSDGSQHIQVYRRGIWQDTSFNFSVPNDYESYDLNFIGDNYFFLKKYGALNFPDKELASVSKNKCSKFSYARGYIYPDSIRCKIEFRCPVETKSDSDEIVFTKVEVLWGYRNGVKALQNKIQAAYLKSPLSNQKILADSAFMFSIVIDRKDSCLIRIELTKGNYSPIAQFLIDELRAACEWTPSMQGGRLVRSYSKIFIRLNRDRSILVVTPTN